MTDRDRPTNPYAPGIPFQALPVPNHFIPRPQYADRLRQQLLRDDAEQSGTVVVSAIQGLGGIGKSVLAAALAHEPEIRDRFPDGVLWVTLGQQPDLLPLLGNWIDALGDCDYTPTTLAAASSYLESLLGNKTMLLVVDDLWNPEHFEPFWLVGNDCRVLVTTRDAKIEGADDCELGVLSLPQSVELVENCLEKALTEADRESFRTFAEAVGYLPLALELAAVQLETKNDWHALLKDFQTEFDRLDRDRGNTPDEIRRQHGLRACFNLSLQQLSAEQLRRFAWLGVLPEDVSVDARMVAKLWQVPVAEARWGLVEFRARSLLLSGTAVSADGQPEPTFRQHDLLHDLARELIVASPAATLPGLGLSVAAAHEQLLERYRPVSGHWWNLADDGYVHQRLTWHLEQAGQIAEMQALIRSANGSGRNAWSEACEVLGLLAVFAEDVARAWRCAEEMYGTIPTHEEGWRWQLWCAFATVSLNSVVGSIPGKLLAIAVQQGRWSEARAVAYVLRRRDEEERSQALAGLMSGLRGQDSVNAAIAAAEKMFSKSNRDRVLVAAIEHWSNFWSFAKARNIVRLISEAYARAKALTALAEAQPELFSDALEAIGQISQKEDRAEVLSALVEKLPKADPQPQILDEALELARQISSELYRTRVFSALVDRKPELVDEMLELARQTQNCVAKAQLLSALVDKQPDLLSQVAFAIRRIPSDSKGERSRIRILKTLVNKLPAELLGRELEIVRLMGNKSTQARVLLAFMEKQPELWGEVLDTIHRIPDRSSRVQVLSALVEKRPELLDEALIVSCQISDALTQARSLAIIAAKQPDLFGEALEAAGQICAWPTRVNVLTEFVRDLPTEYFEKAIELTCQIANESDRVQALIKLAKRQPGLWDGALEQIGQISDESTRSQFLFQVASQLSNEAYGKALEMAGQLPAHNGFTVEDYHGYDRSSVLRELIGYLPSEWFCKVLAIVCQFPQEDYRGDVLYGFAEKLPNDRFGEVLALIHQTSYESVRDTVLEMLVDKLPANLSGDALELIRQISDERARYETLRKLAKNLFGKAWDMAYQVSEGNKRRLEELNILIEKLPIDLSSTLMEVALQISSKSRRSGVLIIALSGRLPAEHFSEVWGLPRQIDPQLRGKVLRDLVSNLPPELCNEELGAFFYVPKSEQFSILKEFAKRLPINKFCEALEIACWNFIRYRITVLDLLMEKLPIEWFDRVLELVRQMPNEAEQARALIVFANKLSESRFGSEQEIWNEVLELIRRLPRENPPNLSRDNILAELLKEMPVERFREVLDITCTSISSRYSQDEVLVALVEKLPVKMFDEAIALTHQIYSNPSRDKARIVLMQKLPVEQIDRAVEIICRISDRSSRISALTHLVENFPASKSNKVLEAIRQITRKFGQDDALVLLIKKLPVEWFSEALDLTRKIDREEAQVEALVALAKKLPAKFSGKTLERTFQLASESDRAEVLIALAEKLPEKFFGIALELTYQISDLSTQATTLEALAKKRPDLFGEVLNGSHSTPRRSFRVVQPELLAKKRPKSYGVALQTIRQTPDESKQVRELKRWARELPPEFFGEVLKIARQMSDESCRTEALIALTSKLPPEFADEARRMALAIRDPDRRRKVLSRFTDATSWQAIATEHDRNLLRLLSTRDRKPLLELLPKLHPTLLELGGQPAADAAIDAMRDACHQWP